jgi:hypothetical protein
LAVRLAAISTPATARDRRHERDRLTGFLEGIPGLQSGVVNDYVIWIVIGLAALGGIFAAITG